MPSSLPTPATSQPPSPSPSPPLSRIGVGSNESTASKKFIAWIPTPLHPAALELAREYFDVIEPRGGDSKGRNSDNWFEFADCSIVTAGKLSKEDVERADRLKIITRNGVGIDSIPLESCERRSIVVTNQPGCNSKAVAEITLGLAISVSRKLNQVDRRLRSLRGNEKSLSVEWRSPGLENKVVGLIGMGDIARETAKKFIGAFDCTILVYSPTSSRLKWTDQDPSCSFKAIPHQRIETLEQLLKESDIVSLHCPLNDETRGLIGSREFSMMKPNAIILNTARGGLIDEVALVEALESNTIYGAGIDTLEFEPPTFERYPRLLSLDNCLVLPHVGAQEEETIERACLIAVETAWDYLNGKGIRQSNRVV